MCPVRSGAFSERKTTSYLYFCSLYSVVKVLPIVRYFQLSTTKGLKNSEYWPKPFLKNKKPLSSGRLKRKKLSSLTAVLCD
jgi:hypothetical protein